MTERQGLLSGPGPLFVIWRAGSVAWPIPPTRVRAPSARSEWRRVLNRNTLLRSQCTKDPSPGCFLDALFGHQRPIGDLVNDGIGNVFRIFASPSRHCQGDLTRSNPTRGIDANSTLYQRAPPAPPLLPFPYRSAPVSRPAAGGAGRPPARSARSARDPPTTSGQPPQLERSAPHTGGSPQKCRGRARSLCDVIAQSARAP